MHSPRLLVLTGAAILLPATVAAFQLGPAAGTLAGMGTTPTHDFPVKATDYTLEVSDWNKQGQRTVTVTVPVEAIDTNNNARNRHMRNTIFEGYEAGHPDLVFTARTDAALAPGSLTLDGALEIVGQLRPVTVALELSGQGALLDAQGTATVDLEDYGIDTPGFGPMKVDPVVDLEIDMEVPADDSAAQQDLSGR